MAPVSDRLSASASSSRASSIGFIRSVRQTIVRNMMIYLPWRASRVIAGPAFARGPAGRKVRTPWSSRWALGTKVLAGSAGTKVFGGGRLRLKGNAPGNARGLTLRAVRTSEAGFRLRTVPQKINRRCNAPRWPSGGKPSDGLKAARASGLRKVIALGKGETVG
jgi:hypothetical protein